MTYIKKEPTILRRALATLIDYTIIWAFFIWFVLTFGEPNEEGGKTVSGGLALIPVLFWFSWLVLVETFFGVTLGHEIMKLKVVSDDGNKLNFGQALKRRLCDVLEISWCFGLIAFLLVKNTQYNQRLGDILAKTHVLDKAENISIPDFEFENSDSNNSR